MSALRRLPRRGRRRIPLAPPVATPFRRLVEGLGLPRDARVLDIGAGGFGGDVTTRHLIELFDGPVHAVELHEERAAALRDGHGDELVVEVADAFAYRPETRFDLIVVDLDSGLVPRVLDELLAHLAEAVAAPESVVVTNVVTDLASAFSGPSALHHSGAEEMAAFLKRRFGRLRVGEAELRAAFSDGPWEFAGLTGKYDDDPLPFMGWLTLRRGVAAKEPAPELAAPKPAAKAERPKEDFATEIRRLAGEGRVMALDLIGDGEPCDESCAAFVGRWAEWARTSFRGVMAHKGPLAEAVAVARERLPERAGSELVVPAVAPALLAVDADEAAYLARIGAKSRNMLRKFERQGYESGPLDFNAHLDDIHAINTSKPVRSGGPMTEAYLQPPKPIGDPERCPRHRSLYVGAFREGRLWGYSRLVVVNELAVIDQILGHADALRDGVMNGLVAELVRTALADGEIRAINYLTLHSSTATLDRFKRSVGFESYAAVLQVPA